LFQPSQSANRLRALAASALICGGLAGSGCASGGKELDIASARTEIEQELSSRFDIRLKSLDCPAVVHIEDGAHFSCTGTDRSGRAYDVEVQLIGTKGGFTFSKPKRIRDG
jgi:hypothetical protein